MDQREGRAMSLPVTDHQALIAVNVRGRNTWSAYTADEVYRLHRGKSGPVPSSDKVLRRLGSLERRGFLEYNGFTEGYYDYHWTMTEAGKAEFARLDAEAGR